MKRAILFGTFAALCGAQTTVNGGRDYKGTLKASGSVSAVDFSGAGGTAPAKAGISASRPSACTQGQIYFATDVAAGQNLYFCTVTGTPGVWTQMSGDTAAAMTTGSGAPGGGCTPPAVYVDAANQDLWFCGATDLWKRPTADTSGLPTLTGVNTWTGYSNLSGAQWRPPESTVANLPSASGNVGKVFMVTDAAAAGSCSAGGGFIRELCRANGSAYECVGGCGSTGGSGGSAAYVSPLISGPDSTRIISGATHGFATAGLLIAVYDNASPRNAISVGWTVDAGTYDVAITFASPQSNYHVVINGGVGPVGPAGPAGEAGPAGSGSGTVTSASFTGGLVTVANPTTTPAFSVAGTSGGIPYFSGPATWAPSAALASGQFVLGGGAGAAPATSFSVVPIANGGTGTASTLTGFVRGSGSAMTAAELSGDASTSGSTAVTLAAKHKTRQFGFMLGAEDGPALADTNDQPDIFINQLGFGIHVTQVSCRTDSATALTMNLQRNDGSAANILSSNLSCSSTLASSTTFTSGEDAIADGHGVNLLVASAGGVAKRLTIIVQYTVD